MVLLLSGCQTSSVDALNVGSPQTLTLPPPVEANKVEAQNTTEVANATLSQSTTPTIPSATGAAKNGFYPTIGRERTGAAKQLDTADLASIRDELRQASEKSSQRATTKSAAEYQSEIDALRKQAATHGKDALKKIEEPSE